MNFHDVRFPTGIAFGSSGGPERKTEIVALGSGYEERNAVWANSRRSYNVGYGVKSLDDIHAVVEFFEARLGPLYGFRFKDFSDFKSCPPNADATPEDQLLGLGNASVTQFPLVKTYSSGSASWLRSIAKPVAGTVRVALAGAEQTSGWSVDATTGLITFASAPGHDVAITAGYEFDVPVRFDSDALTINLDGFRAGEIPSIPIVEIRL